MTEEETQELPPADQAVDEDDEWPVRGPAKGIRLGSLQRR